MDRELAVKKVLDTYLTAGLIKGDIEELVSLISDNIFGIGMGEQGFVKTKQDVEDIMHASAKPDAKASYELIYDWLDIRFQSDNVACLCAKIIINRTLDNVTTKSGLLQSLSLRLEGADWKITALHASPVILTEESIESYPLAYADNTLAHLRSELQMETLDLLNQSISGGILGTYITEGAPLYFINDGMLSNLGYTREEFSQEYNGFVLNIIHPQDRRRLAETVAARWELSNDYEGQYRLRKKDGTYLWMQVKSRRTQDEAGVPVMLSVFVDITELMTLQKELQEQTRALSLSEERFRIALEKTSNVIFDYDVVSGSIMHSSMPKKSLDYVTSFSSAKETLIIGGTIQEESMPDFLRAFEEINSGAQQSSCVVQVRLATGLVLWDRITLNAVTDEDGRVVRAIGTIEDITKQKEAELNYAREEQYRQAVTADALGTYIINFTRDQFESCDIRSSCCTVTEPNCPYEYFMEKTANERIFEEYKQPFINRFSRDSVMEAFKTREKELSMDYHAYNFDGTDLWMRTTIRLFLDAATGDKSGFLYVTDVSEKKIEELALKHKSECDQMTGVYNKTSAELKIREALKTPEGVRSGAFLMIDVDRFKEINDNYGHPFGDKVLIDAAAAIRSSFRSGDVVGRLGGDEFCVFFSGIDREFVARAATKICVLFRTLFTPSAGKLGPSCSIGVSLCTGTPKSFEEIYAEADRALYYVKNSTRNGFAFSDEVSPEEA